MDGNSNMGMQAKESAFNQTIATSAGNQMTEHRDDCTTVLELRSAMNHFVLERDWSKFHTPKNLAASVSIEAAELLELFQWSTPDEAQTKANADPHFRGMIADEMSDVFLYLLSLANCLQLDVADSIFQKLEKNRKKYPLAKAPAQQQSTI